MGKLTITKTPISGLYVVETDSFLDHRGAFARWFCEGEMKEILGNRHIKNVNFSRTVKKGSIRGMHFQKPPYTQAKLVRVVKGRVLDVAVDLRKGSPTYGKHVAVELTEDNHRQFFVPRGFAHGFAVLSEEAIFQYKCDNYYAPQAEGALAWDDPDVAIDWGVPAESVILSEKDSKHPKLKDLDSPFELI